MAIAVSRGTAERARRKVWPAANAKAMAVRWFEQTTRSSRPGEAGRCAWCSSPLGQSAIQDGTDGYCGHDCAAAVRIAGLYLG
jgi:hypothetical protein